MCCLSQLIMAGFLRKIPLFKNGVLVFLPTLCLTNSRDICHYYMPLKRWAVQGVVSVTPGTKNCVRTTSGYLTPVPYAV